MNYITIDVLGAVADLPMLKEANNFLAGFQSNKRSAAKRAVPIVVTVKTFVACLLVSLMPNIDTCSIVMGFIGEIKKKIDDIIL